MRLLSAGYVVYILLSLLVVYASAWPGASGGNDARAFQMQTLLSTGSGLDLTQVVTAPKPRWGQCLTANDKGELVWWTPPACKFPEPGFSCDGLVLTSRSDGSAEWRRPNQAPAPAVSVWARSALHLLMICSYFAVSMGFRLRRRVQNIEQLMERFNIRDGKGE